MSKGDSGRVVIELDPALKRRLYSALAIENSTLKDWFVDAAKRYVAKQQPRSTGAIKKDKGTKRP
jgi:hypothetical protein